MSTTVQPRLVAPAQALSSRAFFIAVIVASGFRREAQRIIAGSTSWMAGTATNVEHTENRSVRQINITISLAFLAPNLVQAAVDGRLPRGVGIANLRNAHYEIIIPNPIAPQLFRDTVRDRRVRITKTRPCPSLHLRGEPR
jgi:hypothetical protein